MKTRRQRKGGTKRGGLRNALGALTGNLKNGGGRILQWNQIVNAMSDEGFRMFKGMTVMMGGEDINDDKYKNLNVKPKLTYMTDVNNRRGSGSATAQITAAAIKGPVSEVEENATKKVEDDTSKKEDVVPENNAEGDVSKKEDVVPENNAEGDAVPENNADGPSATSEVDENKKGGTRKNYRNRI